MEGGCCDYVDCVFFGFLRWRGLCDKNAARSIRADAAGEERERIGEDRGFCAACAIRGHESLYNIHTEQQEGVEKMFRLIPKKARQFQQRLTRLDNQPLSRAALVVIVFL